jgi:hypothetical protein
MEEAVLVHMRKTFKEFKHDGLHLSNREGASSRRNHIQQVAVDKIENEVKLLLLHDQLLQTDNPVVAFQLLE